VCHGKVAPASVLDSFLALGSNFELNNEVEPLLQSTLLNCSGGLHFCGSSYDTLT